MFDDLKHGFDGVLKLAVAGSIAAAAAIVAFFCFAVALFLFIQQNYGALEAWLAIGALFVLVAAAAGIALLIVRRRARGQQRKPREGGAALARLLQEPAVLLTGLQIARALGVRRVLPLVLLAAVAGGLLTARNGHHAPARGNGGYRAADPAE